MNANTKVTFSFDGPTKTLDISDFAERYGKLILHNEAKIHELGTKIQATNGCTEAEFHEYQRLRTLFQVDAITITLPEHQLIVATLAQLAEQQKEDRQIRHTQRKDRMQAKAEKSYKEKSRKLN